VDHHPSSRRGRLRRFVAAAVGLALLVPAGAGAQLQDKLEEARAKVKAIKKDLDAARARQEALKADVLSINRQWAQANAQKQAIDGQVESTEEGVEESEDEIGVLQIRLNERARDVYIQGPAGVVEVVLESSSITDLTDRVTFMDYLSRSDANLVTGIDTERQQLERFQGSLLDLRKEQKRLIRQLKQQSDLLQEKWKAQAQVAALIQEKLDEAKEVVEDLEERYARQLLASLGGGGGRPPPDIDGKPGPFFACPVDRPRSYIDDFGYPRSGGRTHQGNDIIAPKGTKIFAPFDGKAVEGSNSLGGLSVHVYGAKGDYVYNAHLSRYAGVSGFVRAGQVIGYVGDTGNARGGPYHDHFEYHPGGGSAISPYHYLNEVCGVGGG